MILTTNIFVLYRTKIPLSKMTALPLFWVQTSQESQPARDYFPLCFFPHIITTTFSRQEIFPKKKKRSLELQVNVKKREHMMRIRKMIMIDARSLHVKLFFGHAPRMKPIRITILSAHMGGELNLMCFLEKLCGKKSCFLKKNINRY